MEKEEVLLKVGKDREIYFMNKMVICITKYLRVGESSLVVNGWINWVKSG